MDHIGIDVHKRESQIWILGAGGDLIERRIRTTPEGFAAEQLRCVGERDKRALGVAEDARWVGFPALGPCRHELLEHAAQRLERT
jgi:hypothetical protein